MTEDNMECPLKWVCKEAGNTTTCYYYPRSITCEIFTELRDFIRGIKEVEE